MLKATNNNSGCIWKDSRKCPVSMSFAALVMPQAGQGMPTSITLKHTDPNK
ncbi:hypothetical protein HNQ56_003328 [Anaerotaenia torta]